MKNASKAKKVSRSSASTKKQKPLPFFGFQDEMEEILSVHLETRDFNKFCENYY